MRVFWGNDDKTILVKEFSKEWTWQEYQLSLLQMRELLQEVEHKVYVITDTRQIEAMPTDALHHLLTANRSLPSHVIMRCLVYSNKLVYDLYSMLRQFSPADFNNFHFVSTIEAAYQKISDAQK